tara:strand:+ start:3705 stop:5150 length:1446 start_codon:yes stop_codon:yes gene_type:complete
MADTKTSETLAQEVKKQDYGIYNQGRIKLNYNDETQEYSEQYEPTEGYKMFIPPIPKDVKLPTDVTVPELPTTDPMPSLPSEPATPIVQPRDEGETAGEKRRREDMERFGPGQDPMTFSKTMSNIFTPGTEQNLYYSTRGILTQDGNNLTVNFDQIDEEGGYGLPSFLGGAFKYAEKDIISGTVNRLKYAGIIEGGKDIDETKGLYTFTINREKMDKYTDNVSSLANKLTGGYRDANGNFVRRNDYLIEELGKLGKDDATKFISDMAIASDNDNMKNIIDNAIANGTRGAAAALIAFQTGEELDLDRKGLFGFTYYNDAFKEAYTNTLTELKGAESPTEKEIPEEQPTDISTQALVSSRKEEQRQQSDSMKNTFDNLVNEAKKSNNPQVKTALLNQASAYSGAGDIADPINNDKAGGAKQFPSSYGGVYQGDTKKNTSNNKSNNNNNNNKSNNSNKSKNQSIASKLSSAKKEYGSLATRGK